MYRANGVDMGDDATIHARMLSPISIGHHPSRLGDATGSAVNDKRRLLTELVNDIHRKNSSYDKPRKEDFLRKLGDGLSPPAGTELAKKKSYHPELRTDAPDEPSTKMDIRVLSDSAANQHKMELIHLNRTCTCINLMGTLTNTLASGAHVRVSASDANLGEEEKGHRVSFAHPISNNLPNVGGERVLRALRSAEYRTDRERLFEDNDPFLGDYEDFLHEDQEQDSFDFEQSVANISPEGDLDYLEVRPSLASTQLNELRGPN